MLEIAERSEGLLCTRVVIDTFFEFVWIAVLQEA